MTNPTVIVVVEMQIDNMYFGRPERWNPVMNEPKHQLGGMSRLILYPLTIPKGCSNEAIASDSNARRPDLGIVSVTTNVTA